MGPSINDENTTREHDRDMWIALLAGAFFLIAVGIGAYLMHRAKNGAWREAEIAAQTELKLEGGEANEDEGPSTEVSSQLSSALSEINGGSATGLGNGDGDDWEDDETEDEAGNEGENPELLPEPMSRSELESTTASPGLDGATPSANTGGAFSFAVVGDSEDYGGDGYNEELVTVLADVANQNSDFVVFTGDLLTMTGNEDTDRKRVGVMKSLIERYSKRYYIAFGKHDIECGLPCIDIWEELLFRRTYADGGERRLHHSFDYGNMHFVLLSSDYKIKHSIDDDQLAWLENDLKKTTQPQKIVVVHVPPVTFFEDSAEECHDMSCDAARRDKLVEILKRYNVDLVLSGHEHTFDHKIIDDIDYVIAGNSGNSVRYEGALKGNVYSLISVNGSDIVLKAMETGGKVIREIKIK